MARIPKDVLQAARDCASEVLSDITDRSGWRQAWDDFDRDIKIEIRKAHAQIIARAIMAERERCAELVETHGYETRADGTRSLVPSPLAKHDMHHATIAAAIRKGGAA